MLDIIDRKRAIRFNGRRLNSVQKVVRALYNQFVHYSKNGVNHRQQQVKEYHEQVININTRPRSGKGSYPQRFSCCRSSWSMIQPNIKNFPYNMDWGHRSKRNPKPPPPPSQAQSNAIQHNSINNCFIAFKISDAK